ncbi:hypothetical protein K2173_017167 [Erythroxylum novogranatense]|uniref:Uncharacterized protein n=1 Tax=Erythroxylum novogranatense TaxID=1862640 RepID=A0AAV8U745_9ROSI|nr:hypothetical protein K2173_017167 [Erythroxylum novogranatense]
MTNLLLRSSSTPISNMLLRSSSTPILNSWLPHSKDSSPEPDFQAIQRTKSISLTRCLQSLPSFDEPTRKATYQALQENRFQSTKKNRHVLPPHSNKQESNTHNDDEENGEIPSSRIQRLLSSSGLAEKVVKKDDEGEGCALQTLIDDGTGTGSGGKGSNRGGRFGGDESELYRRDSTDAYYQKMIEANPDNALLLGNYAKFLKEVQGDLAKAEEFFGRAILANPNDGHTLSLYADLIWESQKDAQRAESYFDQAVKTDPDDCYVLASYARFLWDAAEEEEEEEEEEEDEDPKQKTDPDNRTPQTLFDEHHPHYPAIAAAS